MGQVGRAPSLKFSKGPTLVCGTARDSLSFSICKVGMVTPTWGCREGQGEGCVSRGQSAGLPVCTEGPRGSVPKKDPGHALVCFLRGDNRRLLYPCGTQGSPPLGARDWGRHPVARGPIRAHEPLVLEKGSEHHPALRRCFGESRPGRPAFPL